MTSIRATLLTMTCLAVLAVGKPAPAQPSNAQPSDAQPPAAPPPSDSNISFGSQILLPKKPRPGPPEPRALPLAWPRLDTGSVLCRSEDDLSRLARRRAGDAVAGTVDCQIIRAPTAITIVQRKGPGLTEVKASGSQSALSGWTDAWLPDKAPTASRAAAR